MGPFPAEIRQFARPVIHGLREVPHWVAMAGQGAGLRVVFLPARGIADGASRLRIYAIARALRARGWRCLVLNWRLTLPQRHRMIRAFGPDVLVMQGARHAQNRPELYPGLPIVYDMDDADFHLPHLEAPVRAAMPRVTTVLAGSEYIAKWCAGQGAPSAHVVWTGTPPSSRTRVPQANRQPVIAWAQTRPMTYEKEADLVRGAVRAIAQKVPDVTLRLFDRLPGDDPAFVERFKAPGVQVEWYPRVKYSDYLRAFDDVSVGLAPLCMDTPFSRGKSFGKVLAYLDRGVPVVGSNAGEHPKFFTPEAGQLFDTVEELEQAATALLVDPAVRQKQADAAYSAFRDRLSIETVAEQVAAVMTDVAKTSCGQ